MKPIEQPLRSLKQLWESAETLAWKNMFRSLRHLARKEIPPGEGIKQGRTWSQMAGGTGSL